MSTHALNHFLLFHFMLFYYNKPDIFLGIVADVIILHYNIYNLQSEIYSHTVTAGKLKMKVKKN